MGGRIGIAGSRDRTPANANATEDRLPDHDTDSGITAAAPAVHAPLDEAVVRLGRGKRCEAAAGQVRRLIAIET